MKSLFDLSGCVAIVTGTSRGLGQSFGRALARSGADLVITSRYPETLIEFKEEIEGLGKKVLPIELEDHEDAKKDLNILIEPDINSFIEIVVPKFFELTISSLLLEAITSEHAARTAAMDNATRNADDIIKETTMLFNKTRQADITKELMDIVNGSEAMK